MSGRSAVLERIDRELPLHDLAWGQSEQPQAAVLVGLTDEAAPRVWLGRRNRQLRHHPGEIAFPGGKREAADATPWVTATREAAEEVGLRQGAAEPLGELRPLVTRTGFEVHPCIAALSPALELQADQREFDSLLCPPLETFAKRQLFRLETILVDGRERKVPHYDWQGDDIWGVTAALLAMLANIAYDTGFDLQRDWKVKP